MTSSPWNTTVVALLLGAALPFAVSCELEEGAPWTTANLRAELVWDAEGRLDADKRVQTSKNYRIAFETLTVDFAEVTLTSSSAKQLSFDPANPPPGYSLCHQGHCHDEDNKLIPYEQVSLELNQGSASSVMAQTVREEVAIDTAAPASRHDIVLGACSDEQGLCEIGPENLTQAGIQIRGIEVKAQISRTDDDTERTLYAVVPLNVSLEIPLSIPLNSDGPDEVGLRLETTIHPTVWDELEFFDWVLSDGSIDPRLFKEPWRRLFPRISHSLSQKSNSRNSPKE